MSAGEGDLAAGTPLDAPAGRPYVGRMRAHSFLALLATGILGCGGNAAVSSGTTSTGAAASSTGCPASAPAEGSSCPKPDLRCSFGDSVTADCRDVYACTTRGWYKPPSQCDGTPDACAADQPIGQDCSGSHGMACLQNGTSLCLCSECPEGDGAGAPCHETPAMWSCARPPNAPCPAVIPNDGTPCSAEGASCTYGFPCVRSGGKAACQSGVWTWQSIYCQG